MIDLHRIGIILQVLLIAVRLASAEFRHDQQIAVGSNAEMSCDLTATFKNQVRWRKVDDVSRIPRTNIKS